LFQPYNRYSISNLLWIVLIIISFDLHLLRACSPLSQDTFSLLSSFSLLTWVLSWSTNSVSINCNDAYQKFSEWMVDIIYMVFWPVKCYRRDRTVLKSPVFIANLILNNRVYLPCEFQKCLFSNVDFLSNSHY